MGWKFSRNFSKVWILVLVLNVFITTVKARAKDEVTTISPDQDQDQDQDQGEDVEQKWTHQLETSDESYSLKWSTDDPVWLIVEMSAASTGFVAMGLSPDGKMNGSDIIMGWVDSNGKPHLKDLYGIGNTKPKEDLRQNVELLSGHEKDNRTTIRFRRPWNTCDDEHDRRVEDAHTIIYAFNTIDPKLADEDGVFRPPYHFKTRGVLDMQIGVPIGYVSVDCELENIVKKQTIPSMVIKKLSS